MTKGQVRRPTEQEYRDLLQLRTGLRQLLHWSEQQARAAGVMPAQHQLLLAIRGHPDPRGPSVGDVARYLFLRSHSAAGLVDRAVAAGLVSRVTDRSDHRVCRLALTPDGARILDRLSGLHLAEWTAVAPHLTALLGQISAPSADPTR